MVKYPDCTVDIVTIETLAKSDYEPYDQFKAGQSNRRDKQQAKVDVQVWADGRWANVNRVIRHKTKKRIFRVLTHTGCVDVTEDHSLLDTSGRKLKPVDAKIGQELLHAFPVEFCSDCKDISTEEAFVMGLFFGDGSCGDYTCHIVEKYRSLFYDKDKYKKVPMCILNAPVEVRREFVRGYRVADGTKTGSQRADCKGKIGCQGLYYLFCSLGENVSINTRESKPNIFRLNSTRGNFRKNPIAIKKIIDLGYNDENEFVYDIETTRGRFSGGVGSLILKNTDSEYIFFPDVKGKTHTETAALLWDHAEKVAADVTKLYPPPMKLEFEEEIYHKFFILSKKRYMYKKMLRDGVVSEKLGHKGVLLSRRDNSNVVRDLYNTLVSNICDDASFSQISGWLVEQVLEMFRRRVSTDKFVITKQIGGVGSLPLLTDNKGVGESWVRKLESGYGNESPEMLEKLKEGKVIIGDYSIPILSKDPVERARQMNLKSARDSVEYYTNSLPAHVSLSMKMRARGIRVAYFKRHSQFLKIDFLYYLKHMTKPVDQVLNAAFRENPVAKNFMTALYKHWIKRQSLIQSLDSPTVLLFK
jgi:hypothetical protein